MNPFQLKLVLLLALLLCGMSVFAQKFTGDFTFTSLATGKVIEGSASKLHLFYANKGKFCKWTVEPADVRIGSKRTFTIRSLATGKCLDGDPSQLYVSDCNGGNYQKWIIEQTDKPGYVWLTSLATGKVIDGNADRLYPSDRNGGDYQKWRMDRIEQPEITATQPARIEAPAAATPPRKQNHFNRNTNFFLGRGFASNNNRYLMSMQTDGNFVVKRLEPIPGSLTKKITILWSTNTSTRNVSVAVFQTDGNLVLYDRDNKAVWASNTEGMGEYLAMQDDGNLVIYDRRDIAVWASNTNE